MAASWKDAAAARKRPNRSNWIPCRNDRSASPTTALLALEIMLTPSAAPAAVEKRGGSGSGGDCRDGEKPLQVATQPAAMTMATPVGARGILMVSLLDTGECGQWTSRIYY